MKFNAILYHLINRLEKIRKTIKKELGLNFIVQNLPLVSVCIPVFNGEKYISETIDSVLNQTYKNYELIIIDNKSTDKTLEITQEFYIKNRDKIRIIQNSENIGFEANWNKCLTQVKGKYIKILPADDYLYPDCLFEQVNVLELHENVALVSAGRHIINDSGQIVFERSFFNRNGIINNYKAMKKMVRAGGNFMGEPAAVMFPTSLVSKAGFFDTSIFYVVDIDYWFRLLLHGDLYAISKKLAVFRISNQSLSVLSQNSQAEDYKKWYIKIFNSKAYKLTKFDILSGIIKSRISQYLKQILYFFTIHRGDK